MAVLRPAMPFVLGGDGDIYAAYVYGGYDYNASMMSGALGLSNSYYYQFCSLANCADGYQPSVALQANYGSFYGTVGIATDPHGMYDVPSLPDRLRRHRR